MSRCLLDTWSASFDIDQTSMVIPDGCRDLILTRDPQGSASAYISPLFDQTKSIASVAGTSLRGFRLKPGVNINEAALLLSINNQYLDHNQVLERLSDYVMRSSSVSEAIECLSSGVNTVQAAAKQLGMTPRSLQRLMLKETARSPSYWLRLSKVRRAAREVLTTPYAELVGDYHYADQAHLCREIKHWFGLPISRLKQSKDFYRQINDRAYA